MSEDDEESYHVYDSEEDDDDIWTTSAGDKGTYQLAIMSLRLISSTAAGNQDAGFKAVLNKRKAKIYDVEAESFTVVDIQHARRAELANTEQVMLLFGLHVSLQGA
jgi:hypothetical protein